MAVRDWHLGGCGGVHAREELEMPSIYRAVVIRYLDCEGNRVPKGTPDAKRVRERSRNWRIRYKDDQDRVRTASLDTEDRGEAQERLADFMRALRDRRSDPFAEHRERPLSEHLTDFSRHLETRNSSQKHLDKTISYVTRILDECRFEYSDDLDPNAVAEYLHERSQPRPVTVSLNQASAILEDVTGLAGLLPRLRRLKRTLPEPVEAARRGFPARWQWVAICPLLESEFKCSLPRQCPLPNEPGMSIASSNDYLSCLKNFANWMVRSERLRENPFRHLAKLRVETDRRRERRPASADDFARLLAATSRAKPFRGLTGPDRVALYLVATMTGLRASELASLTTSSLDLTANPATLTVKAAYAKNRKTDVQPLRDDLAFLLRAWLDQRQRRIADDSGESCTLSEEVADPKLWPGGWVSKAATMLRRDLAEAGVDYQDAGGRFLDFHALRHTFGTNLAKAGVPPKMAQELMRHSDVKLTLGTYSHVGLYDLAGAVESLPAIPGCSSESLAGTASSDDGLVVPMVVLGTGEIDRYQESSPVRTASPQRLPDNAGAERKPKQQQQVACFAAGARKEPPVGLEPTTYALRKRRSAD